MKISLGPILHLTASLILAGLASASSPGASLFVSPTGNDSRDGRSVTGAFATLTRARDEIRRMKSSSELPDGGVCVEILSGKYVLRDSLEFTTAGSGTAKAPVIYQAFGNQGVTLLGGHVLQASELAPVTDEAMRKRLDTAARYKALCVSNVLP
jgi:hypothetical protein